MSEDERLQLCIQELSMITGVVNKDLDYLLYLVLKDGVTFKEEKQSEVIDNTNSVPTFSEWFDGL